MSAFRRAPFLAAALFVLGLLGCASTDPGDALTLQPESLEHRQIQTRRYETSDEKRILVATAGLLQDLGFTLDESESQLGLLVASKDRSAVETDQILGSLLLTLLTGASGPIDDSQKMRACVVTRPFGEAGESILVRVTFQRIVRDNQGRVSKSEGIFDEELYVEFFDKLSKAVFLEGQNL